MRGFQDVIVPVDFTEGAAGALHVAMGLLARLGGEGRRVIALHVARPPSLPAANAAREFLDEEERKLERRVAHFAAETLDDLAIVQPAVRFGDPAKEILTAIEQHDADLVVMGTHGRRGLRRLIVGSVAETVVRETKRSVLTVAAAPAPANRRRSAPTAYLPLQKVLVATDLSTESRSAEDLGVWLAREVGAELHLVHVAEGEGWADGATDLLAGAGSRLAAATDALRERTRQGGGSAAEIQMIQHPRTGSPAEVIRKCAGDVGARLVVLGSHGRDGLARKLLGGTAEAVIQAAECPVLTVPSSRESRT